MAAGVWDFVTGILGGGASMFGNMQANQTNMEIAQQANQFNALQANANRAFAASEAEKARGFNSQESALQRSWSAQQAQQAMGFSSSEAQKARDYTTMMSNSAYQRQVADMKAAGLNPIMAAMQGGGASTPASASPSGVAGSGSAASGPAAGGIGTAGAALPHIRSVMDNVMASAVELARAAPSVSLLKQQADTEKERTENVLADTGVKKTTAAVNHASAMKIAQEEKLVKEQTENEKRRQGTIAGVNVPYVAEKVGQEIGKFPSSLMTVLRHGANSAKQTFQELYNGGNQ